MLKLIKIISLVIPGNIAIDSEKQERQIQKMISKFPTKEVKTYNR